MTATAISQAETASAPVSPKPLTVATSAMVIAFSLAVAWLGSTGPLILDDLPFIALALSDQMSLVDLMSVRWFGHLMPAGWVAIWIEAHLFGLHKAGYGAIQGLVALAIGLAVVDVSRKLAGATWRSLIPIGFLCLSMSATSALSWWANAIWSAPLMLCTLLSIRIMLTATREKQRRSSIWMTCLFVVALLFTEKALLMPVGLLALDVARRRSPLAEALRESARAWRGLWLACGSVAIAYLWLFIHGNSGVVGLKLDSLPVALWRATYTGLPAGNFGGPVAWLTPLLALPPTSFMVYARLLLIAALAAIVITRAGRRLAAFCLGYFLLTVVVLASTRFVGTDGTLTFLQVRYYGDTTVWLTIALAASVGGIQIRSESLRTALLRVGAASMALSALLWCLSLTAGLRALRSDSSAPFPASVTALLAGASGLRSGSEVLDIPLNSAVPSFRTISDNTDIRMRLSDFLKPHMQHDPFVDSSATPLVYSQREGFVPASLANATEIELPEPLCLAAQSPRNTLPLPPNLGVGPHLVTVTADVTGPSQIKMNLTDGDGGTLRIDEGVPQSTTWVEGLPQSLHMQWQGGTETCIQRLQIGTVGRASPP